MRRPLGFLTVKAFHDDKGKVVSTQDAYERGWVTPCGNKPRGWGIEKSEIPLGHNLFLDTGRQMVAYAFGFAAPIGNFVCAKFGVGTGTAPAKVTDTSLQNPIAFSTFPTVTTKDIDGVDFPAPFIARVEFTLGANDANGYLITELGLFSGNDTIIARRTTTGINKSSDQSPTLVWRIRF